MRQRFWTVASFVLLVGLLITGCQTAPATPEEPTQVPTVAPAQPTEAPTAEPAAEGGGEVVVVVNDVPFTMDDLQSLEQVTIETTHKDELKDLLDQYDIIPPKGPRCPQDKPGNGPKPKKPKKPKKDNGNGKKKGHDKKDGSCDGCCYCNGSIPPEDEY